MTQPIPSAQSLLSFPDSEKSPLSIRAKALVFVDPRSRQLQQALQRLAPAELPVLIEGESGTGKELLARHIHRESARSGLFVSVSCGALSPTRAEAELFGHAAGEPSGGASSRAGWFGSANGGTLYLDEIGDLSPALQLKLLAALETHEVLRVGAPLPSPVDVRLVAASSIDLTRAVAVGKFNKRLYHYLNEGYLPLPALRDRPGDIVPMAEYFLGIYSQRLNQAVPLIGEAAQARLEAYYWPGNTRELENVIHFALLQSSGPELSAEHLQLPAQGEPLALIQQQLGRLSAEQRQQLLGQLQATHGV